MEFPGICGFLCALHSQNNHTARYTAHAYAYASREHIAVGLHYRWDKAYIK